MKNNYVILDSTLLYEDEPDQRDGAVPGCSSDYSSPVDNELTQSRRRLYKDTSSSDVTVQSTPNTNKKRKISRSYEAVSLRYADRLKENYKEFQNKMIKENRYLVEKMMESDKELMSNMLASQQSMLRDTITQLLTGLKEIFSSPASSSQSPSQSLVTTQSPPFNLESQASSSRSLPKVILNIKSPYTVKAAGDAKWKMEQK